MEEDGFLRAIQANPNDELNLRIYLDWLDERSDELSQAKAACLRWILAQPRKSKFPDNQQIEKLRELSANLPTEWFAIVSRVPIENCPQTRNRPASEREIHWEEVVTFHYKCNRSWDELQPVAEGERFCTTCQQSVYFCDDGDVARDHTLRNHCIAIRPDLTRSSGDVDWSAGMTMGLAAPRPGHEKEFWETRRLQSLEFRDRRQREEESQARRRRRRGNNS